MKSTPLHTLMRTAYSPETYNTDSGRQARTILNSHYGIYDMTGRPCVTIGESK